MDAIGIGSQSAIVDRHQGEQALKGKASKRESIIWQGEGGTEMSDLRKSTNATRHPAHCRIASFSEAENAIMYLSTPCPVFSRFDSHHSCLLIHAGPRAVSQALGTIPEDGRRIVDQL